MDGHRLIGLAREEPDGSTHRAALVAQFHYLLVPEPKPLGGGRTEQGSVVPGELGEGFREFLQPAIIGKAAIPDCRVRTENQLQPLWGRIWLLSCKGRHTGTLCCPGRQGRARHQAVMECRTPEAFEILPVVLALPVVT